MDQYFYSFREVPFNDIEEGVRVKTVDIPNVELRYMEFAPETTIPIHTHSETVVTMLLEGKMEFTVGVEIEQVSQGDFFVVPANTEHSGSTQEERVIAVSWSSKIKSYCSHRGWLKPFAFRQRRIRSILFRQETNNHSEE